MAKNHLFSREELIEKFGWEEYLIFALMLAVSAFIGIYFWWKGQKNNAEFLMGGQNMALMPVALSLLASFISAITLIGTPREVYVSGTQYLVFTLAMPFVMWTAASCYMPVFYELQVSTSYEYLEWRFNRSVRTVASVLFLIQMTIYMAIVVYTPALAVSQHFTLDLISVTGMNVDLACGVIFVVCIFYTGIGGIKAVMWTDTFQTIVMFGSFLAVIIKGNSDAGGSTYVYDINYQNNRIELFNFSLDMTVRHTVWGLFIGGYFLWLSTYGINQTMVQRYLTVPRKKMASQALYLNAFGVASITVLCGYAGMVIFAYYQGNKCDPIESKLVSNKDQLFPLFVMQVFGDIPCVPGLFVAGVFSGALSTVSSGLNSLAASTMQDIVHGACHIQLDERRSVLITKLLAIVYGIIGFVLIFLIKYTPGVLQAAITIRGTLDGPVLGAFTLGMFFPWANSTGALVGLFSSITVAMWIGFGQTLAKNLGTYSDPLPPTTVEGCPAGWIDNTTTFFIPANASLIYEDNDNSWFTHLSIYELSYMWFPVVSCLLSIIIGAFFSCLCRPQNPRTLNPLLISPGFYSIVGLFPKRIREMAKNLDVGVDFVVSSKEQDLRSRQILGDREPDVDFPRTANEAHVNVGFDMKEVSLH